MITSGLKAVSIMEWKVPEMAKDPYAGSNYDASGMPLGTKVADYDNADMRRRNSVKIKPLDNPTTLTDNDFVQEPLEIKKIDKRDFNRALHEGINVPGMDQVTLDDNDAFLEEAAPAPKKAAKK